MSGAAVLLLTLSGDHVSRLAGTEEVSCLPLWARVVRSDGTIRFKKRVYTSPSLAATAVTGRPMNGWWWWRKYERAPGDWVRLDELRDRRR